MAASSANLSACTDLLLVCCHAVYTGDQHWSSEDGWLLKLFQKSNATGKIGEHHTFVAHVLAATMAALANPAAMIIFSGGKTTDHPRSEADGYADVLSHLAAQYKFPLDDVRHDKETLATDSYQNLLFSILRFKTITGRYPKNVTVFTHAFKERRFLELHAPAIKWPALRIRVQGINPPFSLQELDEVQNFEYARAYKTFKEVCLYGATASNGQKRQDRNWDPKPLEQLAASFDEEVRDLVLQWTGGSSGVEIFPGRLPWEED